MSLVRNLRIQYIVMEYLKNKKCVLTAVMAVVAAIALCFAFSMGDGGAENTKIAKKSEAGRKILKKGRKKAHQAIRVHTKRQVGDSIALGGRVTPAAKPGLDFDDDDEAKLSDEYRKLLHSIREALDSDNKQALLRLAQKMQSGRNWLGEVPFLVKSAMIDALGWFGSSCLPELAGFMADGSEEISQAAIEKYEEALSDLDLSDRERSKLLVLASQVIMDSDAMDSMLFELNNMRNSVAIDTIKQLMATGGKATQAVLPDNIEFFTGEEGLSTPEKLDEWLVSNPDDEFDEELYGDSSAE